MKFSALTTLLATASAQTPDYLLGRWRGINIKYGKSGDFIRGEMGCIFDDNSVEFLDMQGKAFSHKFEVIQEAGEVYFKDSTPYKNKFRVALNEFTGVNFHSTVPYSFVSPSFARPTPSGPMGVAIPDTLEEALLDNTSEVNILLKCRPDVHDKYCDFSSVKPGIITNDQDEYENSDSDSDEDEKFHIVERSLIVSPNNQVRMEIDAATYKDGRLIIQNVIDEGHKSKKFEGSTWITGKGQDGEFIQTVDFFDTKVTQAFKIQTDEGAHFAFLEAVQSANDVTSIAQGMEDPTHVHAIGISCLNNWCNFERASPGKKEDPQPENLASLFLTL